MLQTLPLTNDDRLCSPLYLRSYHPLTPSTKTRRRAADFGFGRPLRFEIRLFGGAGCSDT